HFADFIGRGDNPVGQHVLHLLQERGVPLDGTDECWRFCRDEGDDADVPTVPDRRRSSGRRALWEFIPGMPEPRNPPGRTPCGGPSSISAPTRCACWW